MRIVTKKNLWVKAPIKKCGENDRTFIDFLATKEKDESKHFRL
ncbi:hypothetical protein [Avibacterium paragallinarum]